MARYVKILPALLLAISFLSCALDQADRAAKPGTSFQKLVEQTGTLEVPRYVRYRELDPRDRLTVLQSPTLQRGRPGRPIVLKRAVEYLYAIAGDGTFLVAEKRGLWGECGHTNLTGGRPARISGELKHDPRTGDFVMDNDSGRYGFQLTRLRRHLEAARRLLNRIGVVQGSGQKAELALRWIQPWNNEKYLRMDRVRPVIKGAPSGFDTAKWRQRFIAAMGFGAALVAAGQRAPGVCSPAAAAPTHTAAACSP